MTAKDRNTQALIDELVRDSGCLTAVDAIRAKAAKLINLYVSTFGEPTMPLDMEVLSGLAGIKPSDDAPVLSEDAELVPDGTGGVTMRVNRDRPEARQRFSIAHEISHTFFPDYTTKEWCRTDSRYRDRSDPAEYLEMLCDIGAAELLLPQPWFSRDCEKVNDATGLLELSSTYNASREATLRRYAETSSEPLAAVFFYWKLKPTQKGTVGNRDQGNLFGIDPEEERQAALRLRIEYTIRSRAFEEAGYYLPADKSVKSDGPLYQAAVEGVPVDGECFLDLGQAAGTYRIAAIPLWTPEEARGAAGESAVAAVLRPVKVSQSHRKRKRTGQPSLFPDNTTKQV